MARRQPCGSAPSARPPAASRSPSRAAGSPAPAATATTSSAKGFICPKGASFGELDGDPDRLRTPLVRTDGELREATWEEAFDAVAAGLGRGVASTAPTRSASSSATRTCTPWPAPSTRRCSSARCGTRNVFTASTLDQMPKHVSSGLLFGDPLAIPVPDLDRTDHLLLLGANPLESNGSPVHRPRLPRQAARRCARRGGTLTVDRPAPHPHRRSSPTGTCAIRPGTDALLLRPSCTSSSRRARPDLGALGRASDGCRRSPPLAAEFTPEAVAGRLRRAGRRHPRARPRAGGAPTAAVYGRIGSCTVEYGTLASWLVDVLNILTGNLDRPGGALFPQSATARPAPRAAERRQGLRARPLAQPGQRTPRGQGRNCPPPRSPRRSTRPGEGRVRALITVAANPVLSAPDGDRLDRALDALDFMVSVDPYLNETTRHADVVLPPPPPPQAAHYDFALQRPARCATRSATPAPPSPLEEGGLAETEILARLVLVALGCTAPSDPGARSTSWSSATLGKAVADRTRPSTAATREELAARLGGHAAARAAPRHDAAPRPVRRRLRRRPRRAHPGDAARAPARHRPRPAAAAAARSCSNTLAARSSCRRRPIATTCPGCAPRWRSGRDGLVLVGRRHLRSNNSWMHNVPALTGGTNRCTLQIHPDDAAGSVCRRRPPRIKGAGGELHRSGRGHRRRATRCGEPSARLGT